MNCLIAPEDRGASPHHQHGSRRRGRASALSAFAALLLTVSVAKAADDDAGSQLLPIEQSAPAFTLSDSRDEVVALASQRGRNVVVHFFATWCEPCRDELPALNRLVARADDAKLAVLAISVAEVPIRVRRFLGETPVNFPVLLDQDRAVAKAWGVDSLPATFILDANHKPRLAVMREYDWDSLDIASVLEKLSRGEN